MKREGPRQLGEFLAGGNLSRIAAEARHRRELVVRVRAALEPDEAAHVVSAVIDGEDRLVVGMDSAAWAARLRYSRQALLGYALKVRVTAPGMAAAAPGE